MAEHFVCTQAWPELKRLRLASMPNTLASRLERGSPHTVLTARCTSLAYYYDKMHRSEHRHRSLVTDSLQSLQQYHESLDHMEP